MEPAGFVDSRIYTVEEYLDYEEKAESKHDFVGGRILDMAGGTADHNSISVNIASELGQVLKGTPCRVFGSDMRLQAHRSLRYTYPDVQVVCGKPEHSTSDRRRTTINNPRVVIEVLSPSSEARDRGEKFYHYVGLPSLEDYILINQHTPLIELFHRDADGGWRFSRVEGLDATLYVQSLDVSVPLAEIYRHVEFAPPVDS